MNTSSEFRCQESMGMSANLLQLNPALPSPESLRISMCDMVFPATWLRPDVSNSTILIRGLSLIRDHPRGRKLTIGDGVAIYIKDYLSYESVYDNLTPCTTGD